ncbi:MAG TPA: hypothetical protein DDY32_19190, partial [Desulfobulbaceae bacterium]|nr:hypothetical protein [Desulfobulbaceae bacterium]
MRKKPWRWFPPVCRWRWKMPRSALTGRFG